MTKPINQHSINYKLTTHQWWLRYNVTETVSFILNLIVLVDQAYRGNLTAPLLTTVSFSFSRVDPTRPECGPEACLCGWDCNGTHNAAVILSSSWLWGPFPSHNAQHILVRPTPSASSGRRHLSANALSHPHFYISWPQFEIENFIVPSMK